MDYWLTLDVMQNVNKYSLKIGYWWLISCRLRKGEFIDGSESIQIDWITLLCSATSKLTITYGPFTKRKEGDYGCYIE